MTEPVMLGTSAKDVLPYEYQAEERQLARKRAIAELYAKQAFAPEPQAEMYGKYRVKKNPMQYVTDILNQKLAGDGLGAVDAADAALAKRYAGAQSADLQRVMQTASGTPDTMAPQPQALEGQVTPMADGAPLPDVRVPGQAPDIRRAISQAMLSQFPRSQAYGADLQKNDRSNMTEIAKLIGAADPVAGSKFLQGGNSGAAVPQISQPPIEFLRDPDGKSLAIARDAKGGKPTASYAPVGSSVTVHTGEKTNLELDKANIKMLETERIDAQAADAVINTAIRSTQLLNKGSDVGGGASLRQAVRKFAQGFGMDVAETGLTEEQRMTLGQRILDDARKLAPVTTNDVELLNQFRGSIDTDPNALREINAIMLAKSLITQDLHNARVTQVASSSDGNPTKYDAMRVTRKQVDTQDPSLLGRAYQLMKERGHDMSGYMFDGQPVDRINLNIGFTRGRNESAPDKAPIAGRTVPDGLKLRAP